MLLRIVGKPDKRLKQLVKEFGDVWRFIKYSPSCSCLARNPGYYVETICGTHKRWVEQEYIEEIPDVT
jgi:hypothetical protein